MLSSKLEPTSSIPRSIQEPRSNMLSPGAAGFYLLACRALACRSRRHSYTTCLKLFVGLCVRRLTLRPRCLRCLFGCSPRRRESVRYNGLARVPRNSDPDRTLVRSNTTAPRMPDAHVLRARAAAAVRLGQALVELRLPADTRGRAHHGCSWSARARRAVADELVRAGEQ